MDMFQVHANDFIKYCIQQEQQTTIHDTSIICSREPQLLDEDYECHHTQGPTCVLKLSTEDLHLNEENTQSTMYNHSPIFEKLEDIENRSQIQNMLSSMDSTTKLNPNDYSDENKIHRLDPRRDTSRLIHQDCIQLPYDSESDDSDTNSSKHFQNSSLSSHWSADQLSEEMFTINTEETSEVSINEEEDSYHIDDNSMESPTYNHDQESNSFMEENPSKSFLQLRGISIANYNMGCNFDIASTIRLMMLFKLNLLAIQEHTPWSRELSDAEILSFRKNCDKWGFNIITSKLQLAIIDKQLTTCLRETDIHEDGRIIRLRMEISAKKFVNFVITYGYPHSPNNRSKQFIEIMDENMVLQKMRQLKQILTTILNRAINADELIFIFGDLQDTPDNSKMFSYGTSNIIKHPLGIVRTCENL
jgi:hypothetical protein